LSIVSSELLNRIVTAWLTLGNWGVVVICANEISELNKNRNIANCIFIAFFLILNFLKNKPFQDEEKGQ